MTSANNWVYLFICVHAAARWRVMTRVSCSRQQFNDSTPTPRQVTDTVQWTHGFGCERDQTIFKKFYFRNLRTPVCLLE